MHDTIHHHLQIQSLAVWANVGFHYSHSFCYFLSSPSTSSFELSGVGGAHLFAMAFYSPTNIIIGKKTGLVHEIAVM